MNCNESTTDLSNGVLYHCNEDKGHSGHHMVWKDGNCVYSWSSTAAPQVQPARLEVSAVEQDIMQRMEESRPWFLTVTGGQFYYDSPETYPYSIQEIAHALSMQCRFCGHLPVFYSVAQHSVLVAKRVRENVEHLFGHGVVVQGYLDMLCRMALLHDASEAYACDIPRPLKHMPFMVGYREFEKRVERAIFKHFDLRQFHKDEALIKQADVDLLLAEKLDVRKDPQERAWKVDKVGNRPEWKVEPCSRDEGSVLFLRAWMQYGGAM